MCSQFPTVALFIMLYRVILAFESVNQILKCNHSNETPLLCSTVLLVLSLCSTE